MILILLFIKDINSKEVDTSNPPAWFKATPVEYDTSKPWKDGRLEIRRLLGFNKQESNRQAIKLTLIYYRKKDIGDGHELPMYLYLGQELKWAIKEYNEFLLKDLPHPPIHAYQCLASIYLHYNEFDKAEKVLRISRSKLPEIEEKWRIARIADIHEAFGDLYLKKGETEKAKKEYKEAVRLYPTSKQPWGRHLLKRQAQRVQSKIDIIDIKNFNSMDIKDGMYNFQALGYSGNINMRVIIKQGKIEIIRINNHKEKIDQGATSIIPERIIKEQRLDVDNITGATKTCDAIKDGVRQAVKQAAK